MKKIIKKLLIILFVIGTLILCWNTKLETEAATTYPFTGMITGDALGVHSSADYKSSSTVTELAYGTKVTVKKAVSNSYGNFYYVLYGDNSYGYVAQKYILNVDANILTSNASGVETYSTYCSSLISKGFPSSYCPYLYYLHSLHPKWTFTADNVGMTLEEVAKGEEDKNVLQTSNTNYYLRTSPIEGSYYYIKADVIESFMDPRNLMFEDTIFAFLDLESSKSITNTKALTNISGTGNLSKYFNEFVSAANTYKVNPILLMTRSKQEGANTVGYGSISGLYSTNTGRLSEQGYSLDGYYNFFNIGAYQTSTYKYAVQRGLAYAAGYLSDSKCFTTINGVTYFDTTKKISENKECSLSYGRPWNSETTAINGGAIYLSDGYLTKAQNTEYYQKFNVSSSHYYNIYTHQYMTSIYAPISEAGIIYNAYEAGNLIDSSFNFIIPVYSNMSDDIGLTPTNKSSDATLKNIKVNNNIITGFDSDVLEYEYSIQTNDSYVNVTADSNDSNATVSGTGKYNFSDGVVKVSIKVTAEDGTTKTYNVNIKQVIVSNIVTVKDITDKLTIKLDNSYIYGISPGYTAQALINAVTSKGGSATIVDSSNKSKTSGTLVTGDKITIKGTSESKTYTIAIRGDGNGDGNIDIRDFALVQSHLLGKKTLKNEKFYAMDVNYDNKIDIRDFALVQSHLLGKKTL